jgi:hypothetical protein
MRKFLRNRAAIQEGVATIKGAGQVPWGGVAGCLAEDLLVVEDFLEPPTCRGAVVFPVAPPLVVGRLAVPGHLAATYRVVDQCKTVVVFPVEPLVVEPWAVDFPEWW